jgi:hypothetical protein
MPRFGKEETDNDEQLRITTETPNPGMAMGMGWSRRLYCARGCEAGMNTRNGYVRVYDEPKHDVVPPFLVGEVAGSLSIDEDRQQLKMFAESILEWLEKSEQSKGARIYRMCRD